MDTSRSESASAETKKLVLRCKTLEAQLKQSISKKEHEEIVSGLESSVEKLNADLERTKTELARLSDLSERIKTLSENVVSQSKAIAQQGKSIETLTRKINDGTVPMNIHQQVLSKQREYEERFTQMVSKDDYVTLQKRYEEIVERLNNMVPRSDYESIQQRTAELESRIANMVPREELLASEAKLQQLESRLSNYVPKADYDELAAKIVALAEEATTTPNFAEVLEETRDNSPEQRTFDETSTQTQVVEASAPEVQSAPAQPAVEVQPASVATASPDGGQVSQVTSPPTNENWFRFENTEFFARTPVEFIEDLEKVPVETIQSQFSRGDVERWFREYVADEASAESLKSIREANYTGEELRAKIIEAIRSRYSSSN
jgi:tetrahydromethanopterin S-methyltransferase subunit G